MDSPAILTVLFAAQKFRTKPSDILHITDGYEAYCFDEVCCYMITQLEEGKRPFFGREYNSAAGAVYSGNSQTVSILRNLGAEVKHID